MNYTTSALDIVDGSGDVVTCIPASGATFSLGLTVVNCSTTDTTGNTAVASFRVTVVDTTAPRVTVPSNISAPATGPLGANVTFSASAVDIVDGTADVVTCSPVSGSTFSIGYTRVTCSATDRANNTGTASFSVTVGKMHRE